MLVAAPVSLVLNVFPVNVWMVNARIALLIVLITAKMSLTAVVAAARILWVVPAVVLWLMSVFLGYKTMPVAKEERYVLTAPPILREKRAARVNNADNHVLMVALVTMDANQEINQPSVVAKGRSVLIAKAKDLFVRITCVSNQMAHAIPRRRDGFLPAIRMAHGVLPGNLYSTVLARIMTKNRKYRIVDLIVIGPIPAIFA